MISSTPESKTSLTEKKTGTARAVPVFESAEMIPRDPYGFFFGSSAGFASPAGFAPFAGFSPAGFSAFGLGAPM